MRLRGEPRLPALRWRRRERALAQERIGEPVHISYFDAQHAWIRDDLPLQGDLHPLDAAWNALAGALGLDAWFGSMNAPVVEDLPADFASLAKADLLEIHDGWNGLGKTHDVVIRFERTPAGFAWRAKIASSAGSLGESTPDPYDPKDPYAHTCTCAVDDKCALARRQGTGSTSKAPSPTRKSKRSSARSPPTPSTPRRRPP